MPDLTFRVRDKAGHEASRIVTVSVVAQTAAGTIIELSGTVSPSVVTQRITAAPAGPVTVRPVSGGAVTVTDGFAINRVNVTLDRLSIDGTVAFNPGSSGSKLLNSPYTGGFDVWGADNITIEGNILDGGGWNANCQLWDNPANNPPEFWVIRNNTFRNFYVAGDASSHSQAIFVGFSKNGLIENNLFENNGTTSHIFFSWWGTAASQGASGDHNPKNICVRKNTFKATRGAFYAINFRSEIPVSSGIRVTPDNVSSVVALTTSPQFNGACV